MTDYPYECAEAAASRALASDAGFGPRRRIPALGDRCLAEYRRTGDDRAWSPVEVSVPERRVLDCGRANAHSQSAYLTAYVLHVMNVAGTLKFDVSRDRVSSALNYLQEQLRQPPPEVQWWPVWAASQAYSVKVLAEFGRDPAADISRLVGLSERLPVFALSYLADALAATNERGPRYRRCRPSSLSNALQVQADRAHVEEVDDAALAWLWNTKRSRRQRSFSTESRVAKTTRRSFVAAGSVARGGADQRPMEDDA